MADSLPKVQLIDIGNVDATFTGTFGSFTVRNYGSDDTSIKLESMDTKFYNVQVGAFGDILLNKSYKPKNFRLRLNVQRNSNDYAKLKAVCALELANSANLFSVLLLDNNSGESAFSAQSVIEENPASAWGPNPTDNVEFLVVMGSVVYIAPTVS